MTILEKLYKTQPANLEKEIEKFVEERKNIPDEISGFKRLISDPNFEKAQFVFYTDILCKTVRTPNELNLLLPVLFDFIDNNLNLRSSILILRIVKNLIMKNSFIPLSFYLCKILKLAINMKVKKGDKKFSYDSIRLSSDDLNTEELQMFIIRECVVLIKKQCHNFSNSIGFPEYASVICNELSSCKIGVFKELASNLIKIIQDRKEYVEEERTKLKVDLLKEAKVSEFERSGKYNRSI